MAESDAEAIQPPPAYSRNWRDVSSVDAAKVRCGGAPGSTGEGMEDGTSLLGLSGHHLRVLVE